MIEFMTAAQNLHFFFGAGMVIGLLLGVFIGGMYVYLLGK